jgi:hypothetical protein
MFLHFLIFSQSFDLSIESPGFHTLTLTRSDSISLNLTDRFAVFLDVPPDTFIGEFREAAASIPAFFSLSLSSFTIRGGSLKLICRSRLSRLHLWLLSQSHCPDATNIAIVNTDNLMRLETGLNGTICLFFHTGAYRYDIQVETGFGFPWVNFFSSRGRGDAVRFCQGEEDICALGAPDLLFMSVKGPSRVNFSYSALGFELKGFHCSVEGLPMVANGSFVDTVPQIDNSAHPWCLSENSGLWQSGRMIFMFGLVLAGCGLLARIVLRNGPLKGVAFTHGRLAMKVRKSFENC